MEDKGKPIHMEVSQAAGGTIAFLLYESGKTSAYTLASDEHIYITDIALSNLTAGALTFGVYVITDATGKRVIEAEIPATTVVNQQFETPFLCPEGVVPVLIVDAGETRAIMQGFITVG